MDPFEAGGLHPVGGALDFAGDEGEGDADAEEPGLGEEGEELADEAFLLGGAEGDVDDVGLCFEELGFEGPHFGGVFVEAGLGAGDAGDVEVGVLGFEDFGALFGGAAVATEEEDGAAFLGGGFGQGDGEVGAGDAFGKGGAAELGGPEEGLAVGGADGGGGAEGGEGGVHAETAEVVEVVGGDPAAFALAETGHDGADDLRTGHAVDGEAEETDGAAICGTAFTRGDELGGDCEGHGFFSASRGRTVPRSLMRRADHA